VIKPPTALAKFKRAETSIASPRQKDDSPLFIDSNAYQSIDKKSTIGTPDHTMALDAEKDQSTKQRSSELPPISQKRTFQGQGTTLHF